MPDDYGAGIIEQVTLRKLQYVRDTLSRSGKPSSGTRSAIRERLTTAVDDGSIPLAELEALLDELDTWGDQRIRIVRMPRDWQQQVRTQQDFTTRVAEAGMDALIGGDVALVPPDQMTAMRIEVDAADGLIVRLYAAKTRKYMIEQKDIPQKTDAEYPEVIFKPFREEHQKAVGFAEIDFADAVGIVSVPILRRGNAYQAEFEEFYSAFEPLLRLDEMTPHGLLTANGKIRRLSGSEVTLIANKRRTPSGGELATSSNSMRSDYRSDPELMAADDLRPDAPRFFCNCYWNVGNGLGEAVHTHISADNGEVTVLGQVRKESVEHVLRRIRELN